ncbi:fructoselysine 6-kinase [Fusibacter paucivorans]
MKKIKMLAIGDNCMDVYVQSHMEYPGGNPVNVSVYAVRLGGEASYIGAVGTDDRGIRLIESLRAKGVRTERIKILEGSTATTEVFLKQGDRQFGTYTEGVLADFRISDEDIAYAKDYDIMVTGIWGMIEQDLPRFKAIDIPIAFDFSDQWAHEIVMNALPNVDYAFFAGEHDGASLRDFMHDAWQKGPKVVVVTLGSNGSIAYDGNDFIKMGVVDCPVVDTMGAGDSFIAGFLIALMEGKNLRDCMQMGAENSAVTIQYRGAW